jgi:hypothetical protein
MHKDTPEGCSTTTIYIEEDYFTGRICEEALSRKPPKVGQQNWEALVNKWSDERNKVCSN